jgi:hypothetical protein
MGSSAARFVGPSRPRMARVGEEAGTGSGTKSGAVYVCSPAGEDRGGARAMAVAHGWRTHSGRTELLSQLGRKNVSG